MTRRVRCGLTVLCFALPAAGQTVCSPAAAASGSFAADAARALVLESQLRAISVPEGSATVPPSAVQRLTQLKDALETTTVAALGCAAEDVSPEAVEQQLAAALHIRSGLAQEPPPETQGGRERNAFAEDGGVRVFSLSDHPNIFEVDFRLGIPCGDDHLLMVFRQERTTAGGTPWTEILRWSAPPYTRVSGAFGGFALLTPVTGNSQHPVWRFVVAHGSPGCAASPRPSHFSLDLLAPTSNPRQPQVVWHFEHTYLSGALRPRLESTEDTIDFRLLPLQGAHDASQPTAESTGPFRFRLLPGGQVEPLPAAGSGEPAATTPQP